MHNSETTVTTTTQLKPDTQKGRPTRYGIAPRSPMEEEGGLESVELLVVRERAFPFKIRRKADTWVDGRMDGWVEMIVGGSIWW